MFLCFCILKVISGLFSQIAYLILVCKAIYPQLPPITDMYNALFSALLGSLVFLIFNYVDAARRFFQSKLQESSLKEKGKYTDKVKETRQRNRINGVSIIHSVIHMCSRHG